MTASDHLNPDQFFHGSRHTLKPGQIMEGGVHESNQGYGQPGEHVYFTGRADVAAHFAAAGYGPKHNQDAVPKIYQVEPVGEHETDPDEEPEFKSYRAKQVRVVRKMPAHELRNQHFLSGPAHWSMT
jgi:hypothetical protein